MTLNQPLSCEVPKSYNRKRYHDVRYYLQSLSLLSLMRNDIECTWNENVQQHMSK